MISLLLSLLLLAPADSSSHLLRHLRYLASDELKGRGNDRPEIHRAAQYIAAEFAKYGLLPAGDEKTYFQKFEVTTGHTLGSYSTVTLETRSGNIKLEAGRDYAPLSYGPESMVRGSLVFAGFGISAPELHYDDYKGIDVTGKIVLIFEHEPQENFERSMFSGRQLTPHGSIRSKVMNAKQHGAAAVLFLPDTYNHGRREAFNLNQDVAIGEFGIPGFRMGRKWADLLLAESGRDVAIIHRSIHTHLTPYSFDLGEVTAAIVLDVVKVQRSLENVIGYVRGETEQMIVIGAHYDHLGLGDHSSLSPAQIGQIHNGADDNASGTAGLLHLARFFAESNPRRGVVFIAFAGEELGLRGSQYYTNHPAFPLEKTIAMINMDMIGRSPGHLLIGGVGTAAEFQGILHQLQKGTALEFQYSQTPQGSSDHLSFSLKKIPVLFFFSGLHRDYHTPSDDWEKIDLERTRQILEVVGKLIQWLDELEKPLQFVDLVNTFSAPGVSTQRYGPRFGLIPDLSWVSGGVRFAKVAEATPAARSNLKAGDILVQFDGREVSNLHDFTSTLATKDQGDEVEVVVLRRGRQVRVKVRLK